jgi:hypothetical protein
MALWRVRRLKVYKGASVCDESASRFPKHWWEFKLLKKENQTMECKHWTPSAPIQRGLIRNSMTPRPRTAGIAMIFLACSMRNVCEIGCSGNWPCTSFSQPLWTVVKTYEDMDVRPALLFLPEEITVSDWQQNQKERQRKLHSFANAILHYLCGLPTVWPNLIVTEFHIFRLHLMAVLRFPPFARVLVKKVLVVVRWVQSEQKETAECAQTAHRVITPVFRVFRGYLLKVKFCLPLSSDDETKSNKHKNGHSTNASELPIFLDATFRFAYEFKTRLSKFEWVMGRTLTRFWEW